MLSRREREENKFLEVALTGKEELEAMVSYANNLDLSNASFLDMGCGVGNVVLRMALEGYKSYGIDYDKDAIAESERARENLGISKELARFAVGNYYPNELHQTEEGRRLLKKTTEQFRVKRDKEKEQKPEWNSPYDALGIRYRDIDLFYSYPYDNEEMILHIFSEFAKPGAVLFLRPVFSEEYKLPSNVERVDRNIDGSVLDVLVKKD
ncbi:methyltransferase domain-containing protein [Candidatus Woesearchaeota archaeon]|nr:MAG: methyltransferase domain-containing protein [Candidatus Woesearchaeota archaeon]